MKKMIIIENIKNSKARSAWDKGVKEYALELMDMTEGDTVPEDRHDLHAFLMAGAPTWSAYSWGGGSLIYDQDICERLCTPSEKKLTRNGERKPNKREDWLDVQARALLHAELLIYKIIGA